MTQKIQIADLTAQNEALVKQVADLTAKNVELTTSLVTISKVVAGAQDAHEIPRPYKKSKSKKDSDGVAKAKRKPTAYNTFMKKQLPKTRTKMEAKGLTPPQKDVMAVAAKKWQRHKMRHTGDSDNE